MFDIGWEIVWVSGKVLGEWEYVAAGDREQDRRGGYRTGQDIF